MSYGAGQAIHIFEGVYQIGEVTARSCWIMGTSSVIFTWYLTES